MRPLSFFATLLLLGGVPRAEVPWRGSSISVSNVVSLNSLDENAELTYNPYYAVSTTIAPRWWLTEQLFLKGSVGFSREITNSDVTSRIGETLVSDTNVGLGARLWRIPTLGIDTSAALDLRLPTSPFSQAQTLILAVQPSIGLRRVFPQAANLSLSYGLGVSRRFHRFTTGELESPYLEGCPTAAVGCEPFLNTGVRNARMRLSQSVGIGVAPLGWLSASIGATWLRDYLHPAIVPDDVNFEPQAPQDTRTLLSYSMELAVQPLDAVTVAAAARTTNPQRAPNSDNYAPFINRYTHLALDIRLDVAALIAPLAKD